MARVESFEELEIWKIAVELAVCVYEISDEEPLKSDWGLKDQIRRAAMSLSDNIAEGFEYNNNADFIRFLRYAKGSSGELRNKLIVLRKTGKLSDSIFEKLYEQTIEFSRKTKSLISYLKKYEADKNQSK